MHWTLSVLYREDFTYSSSITKYNDCLSQLLDKHAPAKEIKVRNKPRAPWYNGEIHNEKLTRRRLERKWYKSRSDRDLYAFRKQRDHVD